MEEKKTFWVKFPIMKEEQVNACPYCGGKPSVSVKYYEAKGIDDSDSVGFPTVHCCACGISAPLDIWNKLGEVK